MSDIAFDTLPCAREIFREVDSADHEPVVYLIRGRSGAGKSTLLSVLRARLRTHGVALQDDPAGFRLSLGHSGFPDDTHSTAAADLLSQGGKGNQKPDAASANGRRARNAETAVPQPDSRLGGAAQSSSTAYWANPAHPGSRAQSSTSAQSGGSQPSNTTHQGNAAHPNSPGHEGSSVHRNVPSQQSKPGLQSNSAHPSDKAQQSKPAHPGNQAHQGNPAHANNPEDRSPAHPNTPGRQGNSARPSSNAQQSNPAHPDSQAHQGNSANARRSPANGKPHADDTTHADRPRHPHDAAHPGDRTYAGNGAPAATPQRSALIVDNAHTLSRPDLEALAAIIESGRYTVVVATQPRPHDPHLRALTEIVSRRGRVVDLRPLGVSDIAPFARELGMAVPRPVAQHIHRQTGGSRGGVVAALTAACSARLGDGIDAVDEAVAAWGRAMLDNLEPDLLETLVVATTGTGLDATELTEVLDVDIDTAQRLIDRARASALVTDADLLLEPAVTPLRTLLGDRRFVAVQRKLLGARLDAGLLRDHTALLLAESGVRDPRLAEFLCNAAEKAGREAVRYYAAAAATGADPDRIALRWAEAAACTGDGETAMRLAEPVLARSSVSGTELTVAVRICAAVLTRRGLVSRAAQLYSWLGAHRIGADWAVGATVQYLAGDVPSAVALSESSTLWPPTEANAHARLIAKALADTIAEAGADTEPQQPGDRRTNTAAAVSALIQAAQADAGIDRFLPCTAVSIATLLCLSTGEPRRAGDALRRAATSGLRCHQLQVLAAWTAMLGGDENTAAATLAALNHDSLDTRDRLLAHGVAVGLARRTGDRTALTKAWQAAYPLFDDVDADLLTLLPIGELWLAGIRLRDERRIAPLVDAALALLRRLDQPPAWANAFHWYGVQAALAHESPQELLPHARLLKAAAEAGDRHAAVLADAGRTWVLVLRGQVAAAPVQAAVAGLIEIGLTWDGARLASEAALAAADSATATTLLKLARTVRADARPQEPAVRPAASASSNGEKPASAPEPSTDAAAILSEREREVAELVLLGLTYREIGARLYISAKTVEHHVARIRRRIGARSRSELLSMLRAMGHGSLLV